METKMSLDEKVEIGGKVSHQGSYHETRLTNHFTDFSVTAWYYSGQAGPICFIIK